MPIWEIIIVSLIVIIGGILGAIVYFKNPKAKSNQTFAGFTLFLLSWILFAFLSEFPENLKISLILSKLTYFAVVWAATFLFYFSWSFPKEKVIQKSWKCLIITLSSSISLLTIFTSLIIRDIAVQPWGFNLVLGNLYPVFLIYCVSLGIIAFVRFLKSYPLVLPFEKLQLKYFFIGIGIFLIITVIVNTIVRTIVGSDIYYRLGNYSAIFFLGFTAYAIAARQLFDIRVILSEILVGVIAIILFIQMMVAGPVWLKILNGSVFILFCLFGYFLVKSVIREIELRQEVEKLSSAKSEFISIASHQLRTPLTTIKGYISMMLEKSYGQPPDKMEKPLENIYASNERLIKLVNDLLNLSRLEAGKIEFNPELTSLEELVSGIIKDLRINIEKKGLDIKIVKPSEPLPKIMLDQDKIRQVILNIVDNAVKYTREGGITIKLEKLNSEEQIKVSDTGEGMDEKEIQSLFRVFSRATAGIQLHTEGAGIGLYIARQFVEMHGGKIWAESPGKRKGSTFIVQLPVHLSPKLLKSETITVINK